jgi:hypothetical protein
MRTCMCVLKSCLVSYVLPEVKEREKGDDREIYNDTVKHIQLLFNKQALKQR